MLKGGSGAGGDGGRIVVAAFEPVEEVGAGAVLEDEEQPVVRLVGLRTKIHQFPHANTRGANSRRRAER